MFEEGRSIHDAPTVGGALRDGLRSLRGDVPRARAVLPLLLLALGACNRLQEVPPGVVITCSSASDCPSGRVCHRDQCADPGTLDTTPPDLAEAVGVSPERVSAGRSFSVTVHVTEPLDVPPTVSLALVPPVFLECSAGAPQRYTCSHAATGGENGGLGGTIGIDVRIVDPGGNTTNRSAVAAATFDFAPPAATVASVAYVPAASTPLPSVQRATDGTIVRVAVSADELLDGTLAPTLIGRAGGSSLPFTLESGGLGPHAAVFSATVPPGLPDGRYLLQVTWGDDVGNRGVANVPAAVEVKTSRPILAVDQSALVFVRSPLGNAREEPLGVTTIPAGPYFAVEPWDPLGNVSTLPAGALLLDGQALPSAVLVRSGAGPDALLLGALTPDARGRFPRRSLPGPDVAGVFLAGVDDAGNVSPSVKLQASEWIATTAAPAFGPSPHVLTATRYASTTRAQPLAARVVAGDDAAGTDLAAAISTSTAVWRRETWSGVAPGRRARPAMAYDAGRGRVVLFGGSGPNASSFYAPSAETWEWDGTNWTLASEGGPSARDDAALAYDSTRGRTVLFGGSSGDPSTWEWDGAAWTEVATTGPSPRAGHAMAHDAGRGQVVLFGGSTGAGETWTWDGAAWRLAATSGPSSSSAHAMAYDAARGQVVLYAGQTWLWDGTSWTSTTATGPGPTHGATMVYDTANARVLLYAALEVWAWDGSAWTVVGPMGPVMPENPYGAAAAYDAAHELLVLFGGSIAASETNQTWVWQGGWARVAQAQPAARAGLALASDPARSRVVMYGGNVGGGETWEWNGTGWSLRASTGPGPREYPALAHDAGSARTILFGGSATSQDTWAWDGSSWTSVAATGPSARSGHAMAHDAARGVVVLFGGTTGGNETWTWSGATSTWSLAATTGPSARQYPAMAYDAARGRIVLFGGTSGGGETWEWDGATWWPVATTGPFERFRHAMAYDASRGRVVLHGGSTGIGTYEDTWEWDGAAWTLLAAAGPGGRWGHGMAYDARRGRAITFGGHYSSPFVGGRDLPDTWGWQADRTRRPALQLDVSASGLGVDPVAVTSLRVRAFAGGDSPEAGAGAVLRGWAHRGPSNEPGTWVTLGANSTVLAPSPPWLPAAPGSLVGWSSATPEQARSFLVAREGLSFQLQPAGGAGITAAGAAVALDYLEVRVRYTAP